ncbi:UbiD family decarboxylase [Chloroflexota bacterium]
MSKDLRHFLRMVKEAGPDYYVEVKKLLKPEFEVCVIQEKLVEQGRFPVVYCSQVEGSKLPLVTNLFGNYEMLGLALDLNPKKSSKAEVLNEYRKRGMNTKPPKMIPASEAPVKEVILRGKDVELSLLPITKHAELDSGKYITIGALICKNPDTGIPNAGVYRHEVKGKDKLGFLTSPIHHAAYIARRCAELGKPLEVVISIGHHPAMSIGACAIGSLDMNELDVIGGLLGEPLRVTPAETVDLPVPADAEVVVEGVIDPCNMTTDGPFAEYTGYYGEGNKPCYLIQVTAITMRKDAIYHDLDPAHQEHNLTTVLGEESSVYDVVKRAVPTLQAVHCPPSGACVYHVYVSIKKRVQGEGKLAAMAAIAAKGDAKLVVVVDEDIDVYNEQEVLWAIATRVVGDLDISVIPGVTGQHLDPSAYDETRLNRGAMNTKVIIDATKPVDLPFSIRIAPPKNLWNSMNLDDYL